MESMKDVQLMLKYSTVGILLGVLLSAVLALFAAFGMLKKLVDRTPVGFLTKIK